MWFEMSVHHNTLHRLLHFLHAQTPKQTSRITRITPIITNTTIIPDFFPAFVVDEVLLPPDEVGTLKSLGKSGVLGSTGAGGGVAGGDQ